MDSTEAAAAAIKRAERAAGLGQHRVLGEGILTWPRGERVSDRYGLVMLMKDGDSWTSPTGYIGLDRSIDGARGTLTAEVLETRQSTHIGDLFRGLFPVTPEVGERITLGTGTVFFDRGDDHEDEIGLRPDDGRDSDWLDPKALYRAHEQTVRLTFEETT
jgi:hypothetical protein